MANSLLTEQFTNDAVSSLNGAIVGVGRPVTFNVTSAATFPTIPQFRVLIDSEILLVTAVSGVAFTATTVENSVAQTHVDKAIVSLVVTGGSLQNIGLTKIDEVLLTGTSALITFNPLPTTYRHILIDWYARGDNATQTIGVLLRLNNISTATYDSQLLKGSAAAAGAAESLGGTSIQIGTVPAASAQAAYFGSGDARLAHYQGATGNKVIVSNGLYWTGDTTGLGQSEEWGGKWRTTATAVTRLDILPSAGNFIAGSLFTIYGIV